MNKLRNKAGDTGELVNIDHPSRKEQILRASLDLFCSKGFPKTTMRDIAKKARVSLGLIYFYFENKQEILKEVFYRIDASFPKTAYEGVDTRTPEETIRILCESHFDFMVPEFKQFLMLLYESIDNPKFGEFLYSNGMEKGITDIAGIIRYFQDKGVFRSFDCENASQLILDSIFMFVLLKEGPFKKQLKARPYKEYSNTLVDILLNGMLKK